MFRSRSVSSLENACLGADTATDQILTFPLEDRNSRDSRSARLHAGARVFFRDPSQSEYGNPDSRRGASQSIKSMSGAVQRLRKRREHGAEQSIVRVLFFGGSQFFDRVAGDTD